MVRLWIAKFRQVATELTSLKDEQKPVIFTLFQNSPGRSTLGFDSTQLNLEIRYLSASNAPGTSFLLRPILGVLQIGIGAKVMDAHTLPISAERNLRDPIEIRVDIVHPTPVDVFPATTVMSSLRFRMGIAEEENASLRGKIKTIEAIDIITRKQEKRARMELE
ncbi:hypothetical protein Tco_0200341 [Tanacetum coccineum]